MQCFKISQMFLGRQNCSYFILIVPLTMDWPCGIWKHCFESKHLKHSIWHMERHWRESLGVPSYSSIHITSEICNTLLLQHHAALVQFRYVNRLQQSKNNFIRLNLPILKSRWLMNVFLNINARFMGYMSLIMPKMPWELELNGYREMKIVQGSAHFMEN